MSAIKIAQKQIYISQDGNSQVYDGWCFTVVFLEKKLISDKTSEVISII